MLNQDPIRPAMKLSCPCGADVRVDPHQQNRNLECPKCGLALRVVVGVDPKDLKRSRVSLVLPSAAFKTGGESLGSSAKPVKARTLVRKTVVPKPAPKTVAPRVAAAPPPPPPPPRTGRTVRGVIAQCACGSSFPVEEGELATQQDCPGCGVRYHVVVKLEKGSRTKSALLVPVRIVNRPTFAAPGSKPPPNIPSRSRQTRKL
jgi:predicted RNA-binding Zn-ribbon protein involved in translation (DUF1610 family)